MTVGCVFCDIVQRRAPAHVIAEWSGSIAIRPLNPVTRGHTLVIPKLHVRDAREDPQVTGMVMAHAAEFARLARHECNIITSIGVSATQTVFHLHVHIVPRSEGDGLALPWAAHSGEVQR